jgi:hypothetical protein
MRSYDAEYQCIRRDPARYKYVSAALKAIERLLIQNLIART